MHINQLFDLFGRVALVTGGAGKYGRQVVEALAESGASVVMASRNTDNLQATADGFVKRDLKVSVKQLDQGDESSIQKLRDEMLDEFGRVDVLVNNAVGRTVTKGWDDTGEAFLGSMRINAVGVFLMTRDFGNAMAEAGGGSIINIGSIMGVVGVDPTLYEGLDMGSSPDYFMHKGAMNQLTRYAASHLGPRGVRVNTISPGGMFNDQDPTFVERYNQRTFLGRMANETDLKGAIAYFASDASAYVTGANLLVDGGYTAK